MVRVTEAKGADVDAAAANGCQAADGEEEERLRENGGHQAAEGMNAGARQQHRTLPVPAGQSPTCSLSGILAACRLEAEGV